MSAISSNMGSSIPMAETESMKTTGKSELDRADFMTLFITQLQYQDPMKPMDSYEMASQLAQFSNMEATMKMSDNMEKLLEYQMSQNNLQLMGLIGKNVETAGNEIGVVDGQPAAPSFTLEEAVPYCMAYIYDAAGNLTRSMDLGYRNGGAHGLDWDGLDNNGNPVTDGLYSYQIDAVSATGEEVAVESRSAGRVTGVEFDSGSATVTINGYAQKKVSDIIKVGELVDLPQTASVDDEEGSTVVEELEELSEEL